MGRWLPSQAVGSSSPAFSASLFEFCRTIASSTVSPSAEAVDLTAVSAH